MLQMPRRNHIMATNRSAFAKRGRQFTTKAVSIRCARPDQTTITVTLHYLHDGNATLRFSLRKQEFFIPVILVLRALKETTDREVYERVLRGQRGNTHLADRVELVRSCLLCQLAACFGRGASSPVLTLPGYGHCCALLRSGHSIGSQVRLELP